MNTKISSGDARRQIRLFRLTLFVLSALVGVGFQPAIALAGSITYTWVEDDGQNVTGSLVVSGGAQTAGAISFSDVVSFNWSDPLGERLLCAAEQVSRAGGL